MQCIQPDEACVSVNVNLILAMAKNTKTSTKPLVVVSDHKPPEPPGELKESQLDGTIALL